MLTIKYKSKILLSDKEIENFLLKHIKLGCKKLTISQISIIYVLRKLIATGKIKNTDVLILLNGNLHAMTTTGRFVSYPVVDDLFDECLDAVLNSKI